MANYLVTDTDLTKVANAIREKAEVSSNLIFPNGFVDAVQSIMINRANATAGTFTPIATLRSITLEDTIGKDNVFIYPMFDFISADAVVRIHWGALFLNGRCVLQGSTNATKNAYVFTATTFSASDHINNADTFDSSTGTVTIVASSDVNYGGCFVAGKTYGYLVW